MRREDRSSGRIRLGLELRAQRGELGLGFLNCGGKLPSFIFDTASFLGDYNDVPPDLEYVSDGEPR